MRGRIALMVASLLLSVVIGLLVARRGESRQGAAGASAGPITVGLSLDTLKEARWQVDRDLFTARAEALGAKVLVQSANSAQMKHRCTKTAA